ncbi:hypothetical protein L6164_005871 [Bauhinia variegata]|uniref:Uncharacterized protein n=1 Tax=Bauhinia variegata TaxID=167791 RepID=A0ACB9PRU4_BAUVA|nr:hypothetical protein L6164_005871 [Bauhinia variegata]
MSHPRVFITLGRTGQVVERGGAVSNSGKVRNGTGPRPGSKRSIGDTSGRYPDVYLVSTKRPRPDDRRLSGNDLRWKLWRRRSAKQNLLGEGKKIHLHKKLSKSGLPSASSNNSLQLRPEAKESFLSRPNPSAQNACHVDQVEYTGNLKSSWILNGLGTKSSDTLLKTSRRLAPQRNRGGQQLAPDVAKSFMANDAFNVSKPVAFPHVAVNSNVENAMPVTQLAPMGGIVVKRSQVVGEPLTVSGLLHSLGLGKYEITFRAEEVDMMALKQMGEKDLKDMGIPMGPRKKILLALFPRSKLQQQPPQGRNMK